MLKSLEQIKIKMHQDLEKALEQLNDWSAENPKPTFEQIEGFAIDVTRKLGINLTEEIIENQDNSRPYEVVKCSKCNCSIDNKGAKKKR